MIWKWESVESNGRKYCNCNDDNVVIFLLVKIKVYHIAKKIPCLRKLFNQINNKIVDKLEEDEDGHVDPKSKMWKQVIRENVIEDKKNEIEDLIAKTDKIEKIVVNKLKEIDYQAKESHKMVEKKLREIDVQAKSGQDKVEKKLHEIDNQAMNDHDIVVKNLRKIDERAKKDHAKRKLELQNMMQGFKTFIDDRKGQENVERNLEINRTIHFMGTLGKT